MLGLHVAETLSHIQFGNKFIITSSASHPCTSQWSGMSYDVQVNQKANLGLATSVAKAATLAKSRAADGLIICLADMPFVPLSHYLALIREFDSSDEINILSSTDGVKKTPPAIFGKTTFASLLVLEGDDGARAMLKPEWAIPIDSEFLVDIDHPETLENYQNMESNQK